MTGTIKAPEGATIQADVLIMRDKDTDFLQNPQTLAPCVDCIYWHECGRLAWMECPSFGECIRLYKLSKSIARRQAHE